METTRRQFEYTVENAESVLAKFAVITEPGTAETPITVGNVSLTKADGSPFTYGESGERYGIVNLRAKTQEQMDNAIELFEEGEYETALNDTGNMSISLPIDEAEKFAKGMLVNATFDWVFSKRQETDVLACTGISVAKAKLGTNSFAERLKAKKIAEAKAEAEMAKEGAESNPTETP